MTDDRETKGRQHAPPGSASGGSKSAVARALLRQPARTLELCLGLAVSLAILGLNVLWFRAAVQGGLWRDEVASVNLASLPTFAEVWQNNEDSFPNLWITLLHAWMHYGPGDADYSLRVFGLVFGLAAVPVCWWCGRLSGLNVPWALLVLYASNPAIIVYGAEVRGYGLGLMTELIMLATLLWFARAPSSWRAFAAGLAALAAVQSAFANSAMLAAAATAWGIVFLWNRHWRALGFLTAICATAALSVIPYLATYGKHKEWADTLQVNPDLGYCWTVILQAVAQCGIPLPVVAIIWPALLLAALGSCLWLLRPGNERQPPAGPVVAWCPAALVLSLAAHFAYMKFLNVAENIWYAFPIFAFTAFCFDLVLNELVGTSSRAQVLRLVGASVLAVFALGYDATRVKIRMTNIDQAAAYLETAAQPDDLVVVWPWYLALAFDRYYHGPCTWISWPDIPDKKMQHPRHFREIMVRQDPIRKELDLVTQTLKAGHHVWVVGGLAALPPGKKPITPPPGPSPRFPGIWTQHAYSEIWSMHLNHLLQEHRVRGTIVPIVPKGVEVHPLENAALLVFEGWSEPQR